MYEEELSLYVPQGFVLASASSRKSSCFRGGGCAIYIKENFDFKPLDLTLFYTDDFFEVTAIILPSIKVVVTTLYRTPNSNVNTFLSMFESFLNFLCDSFRNFEFVVSADFNINIKESKPEVLSFLNILRSFNMYWLNEEPTRGNACLDNIVTTIEKNKTKCKVIEPHISDHLGVLANFYSIYVDRNNLEHHQLPKKIRNTSPSAISNFRSYLLEYDWVHLHKFSNVEEAYDYFMLILTQSYDLFCKVKEVKVSSKTKSNKVKFKWFTPELQQSKKYKLALYDRYKNAIGTNNELQYKKDYLKAKRIFRSQINHSKKLESERFIANSANKCKAAWKVVKTASKGNSSKFTQENQIDSATFNDYFVNLVPNLDVSKSVPDKCALELVNKYVSDRTVGNSLVFRWKVITPSDVLGYVSRLSSSTSLDCYGFSNKLVKSIIEGVVTPLTYLYNSMLEQGVYPKALKVTKVSPIYKKGGKEDPASYRPISLIPIFSKIFESCIKQQLHLYFIQNNLYCNDQFGFIPGGSTVKAVEAVVEHILSNFESRMTSSAQLIDLTKAFDCINHQLLVDKFFSYGIRNKELRLITSYLSERKQMVVQGCDKSSFKSVTVGVPQGSVLGPFLFVIAVNDFSSCVPCRSILYADDTTLINSNTCLDMLLQEEKQSLKSAFEWFNANCLIVNDQKTEKIMFSLNKANLAAQDCKQVKLLGIHLDNKLSWDCHVDQLCKKLARICGLLRKLKNLVSTDILLTVYHALFQSQLRYGVTLWGNSPSAQRALVWQKAALRIIKGCTDYKESCVPIFKEYQIMTLPNLYIICCLISVKETIKTHKVREEVHDYNTRKKYLLELLQVRLGKTKSSHVYMKIQLFNKLPELAWHVPLKKFKLSLQKWFKENVFYSVNEFLQFDIGSLNF